VLTILEFNKINAHDQAAQILTGAYDQAPAQLLVFLMRVRKVFEVWQIAQLLPPDTLANLDETIRWHAQNTPFLAIAAAFNADLLLGTEQDLKDRMTTTIAQGGTHE
jgi:hypothetical protein